MQLAIDSTHQSLPTLESKLGLRQPAGGDLRVKWKLLLVVGLTGLALQLPVQAKPIAGCLVQEADLVDPTSCLSPPESLTSTRPTSQTMVVSQDAKVDDKVARVTLDNFDSGSSSMSGSGINGSNVASCSALRGTHEAQSIMLQNIQAQFAKVDRDRRAAKGMLRRMRESGADQAQLNSVASRVSQYNAIWGALKEDVERRTKGFNNSMSLLTKACLRG